MDSSHERLDGPTSFDTRGPEMRSVAFTDLDVSNDGWSFRGYAAVFDQIADLGEFTEEVYRGSVRKGLAASPNVPMLYDHIMGLPVLATTGGGTLGLKEDGKGMEVRTDLPQHFLGEAVREMVKRGDIRGMSFGFVAGAGNSRLENRGGRPHRILTGFQRILDVSPTWDPAYAETSAELRSLRRMAEDFEPQRILEGTHQQLEEGAAQDHDADAGDVEQDEEEHRSGVTEDAGWQSEAAARSRRLRMLGLSLPR